MKNSILWDITPFSPLKKAYLLLGLLFNPERRYNSFLRKIKLLSSCSTATYPRRWNSSDAAMLQKWDENLKTRARETDGPEHRARVPKVRSHAAPVGIVTGYTVDGVHSREGQELFPYSTVSRAALGPNQQPIKRTEGAHSSDAKQPSEKAYHSHPNSVELMWSYGGVMPSLPRMSTSHIA